MTEEIDGGLTGFSIGFRTAWANVPETELGGRRPDGLNFHIFFDGLLETESERRRKVLTTLTLCLLTQLSNGKHQQPREPTVIDQSVARAAEKAGLAVASVIPKMSDEDVWQMAPFCGANCLYVLLRLNDLDVTYLDLKKEVPTTFKGASLLDLQGAARRFGLATDVIATKPGELRALGFPLIALLGAGLDQKIEGHYVVVCGESDNDIAAVDGTTGNLDRISKATFNRAFSGYVLAKQRDGVAAEAGYGTADIVLLIGCALNLVVMAAFVGTRPPHRRVR